MPKRTGRSGMEPPTDRALQWQDMPKAARGDLHRQIAPLGMASTGVEHQRQRLQRSAEKTGPTSGKAVQRLDSLAALEPHFVDKPITARGAASRRASLTLAGGRRTLEEGTDPSHDWYFQHHGKLDRVAHLTGHAKAQVIAASAVMSPQNNPDQELAAVTALAMAHSNPNASITVSPETVAKHPDLNDWTGRSVHPSELTPDQLTRLSSADTRDTVTTSGVDLHAIAKGGVKGNIEKAVHVLRGNTAPESAIDPRTSPKVWSYHNNIAKAEWGSPEHEEFTRRMRAVTGLENLGQVEGQQSFGPLYPHLTEATHGPLDPSGHTAEDTWQQAISTGQPLPAVPIAGRQGRAAMQSPAKFSVGEGGSANQKAIRSVPGMKLVGESALMHSWQNMATQKAAHILSQRSGEIVPSMGVQAGGWTEGRRQAGKNIEEQEITRRTPSGVQGRLKL